MPSVEEICLEIPDHSLGPRSTQVFGSVLSAKWKMPLHQHAHPHLLFTARGVLNCEADNGVWIVPQRCAIWIPSNVRHSAYGGDIETFVLYVSPTEASLPETCCALSVSPLLEALLRRAAEITLNQDLRGKADLVAALILHELRDAPIEPFCWPIPHDPRLRVIVDALLENPSDTTTIRAWASRTGLGERTLCRIFLRETGVSFGRWRRQLHVLTGVRRLANGERIQDVAFDLGYNSASAFTTMFRKVAGQPPARYLLERKLSVSTNGEGASRG